MSWSWRMGRIAGIDVYVHFTFFLLLAWVAFSNYERTGDWIAALVGLGFILALFGIVVLHELGHALAARRYGIATRDITLLPIGGVARLERMPDDPKQELVVALAGPAVNVVLAAGIFVGLQLGQGLAPANELPQVGVAFLSQLFWINVWLAGFNLLPAFPMDGGRVLCALLAMRMDYVRATQVAASIGQGMAILFGFLGLMYNPFLLFIALFVYLGAAQEASMVQMRAGMDGIPVQKVMITNFTTLHPQDSLASAAEYVVAGFQQDFPVVEGDHVVGILTRNDLISGLSRLGPEGRVGDVMKQEFVAVEPGDMLQTALARLQSGDSHTLLVVQDGRLLGLVTAENLAEVLMIQQALREAQRSRRHYAGGNGSTRSGVPLTRAREAQPNAEAHQTGS